MGEIEDYARLVVRVGVAVRDGQDVLVSGLIEQAPFLRAIAVEAYRAGARHVDVDYGDPWIRRALVGGAPETRRSAGRRRGWSRGWSRRPRTAPPIIHVSGGSNADVYEGLDWPARARGPPEFEQAWLKAATGRAVAWTIVAFPTERWATEIFGEPDVDRLWRAVAHVMRLDEADPAAAWSARLDELEARAARAHGAALRRDPLPRAGHRPRGRADPAARAGWPAARRTTAGQSHVANMPTEEVFTSPHRMRADGTVRATMPFALRGGIVEGLELRLAGGEIVEARATHDEDLCAPRSRSTTGARRLGELALVDARSRVGEPASCSATRCSTRTRRRTSRGAQGPRGWSRASPTRIPRRSGSTTPRRTSTS